MMKIRIEYRGEIDVEMDSKIKDALTKAGFSFVGSGFNFINGVRDLSFEVK